MLAALKEAREAFATGEVPVGAVVVVGTKIVARGHNLTEDLNDPTAHAEIMAIRRAAQRIGYKRLSGCSLYTTLEPCPMCAGAIVLARLKRLVYGASDPKSGGVRSLFRIADDARLNHRSEVEGGVLEAECRELLENFFKDLRSKKGQGGVA